MSWLSKDCDSYLLIHVYWLRHYRNKCKSSSCGTLARYFLYGSHAADFLTNKFSKQIIWKLRFLMHLIRELIDQCFLMSKKYCKILKRNIRISEFKLMLHIVNNFCKSSLPIIAFVLIFIENWYLSHVSVLRQKVCLRKLWNTWELYEKQWDISQDPS